MTNARNMRSLASDCSKRNTRLFRTIKKTVKTGKVREGMTSLRGITAAIVP
jgi:hypothetical protein